VAVLRQRLLGPAGLGGRMFPLSWEGTDSSKCTWSKDS